MSPEPHASAMFGWMTRRPRPQLAEPTPVAHDEVLGPLVWDPEERMWAACNDRSPMGFRILIAGDQRPHPRLVSHARELAASPDRLLADVGSLLRSAAEELPAAAQEILDLHVESVALMWPDRPGDGMIYLDGPCAEQRVWRCDYIAGRPTNLGFDD